MLLFSSRASARPFAFIRTRTWRVEARAVPILLSPLLLLLLSFSLARCWLAGKSHKPLSSCVVLLEVNGLVNEKGTWRRRRSRRGRARVQAIGKDGSVRVNNKRKRRGKSARDRGVCGFLASSL